MVVDVILKILFTKVDRNLIKRQRKFILEQQENLTSESSSDDQKSMLDVRFPESIYREALLKGAETKPRKEWKQKKNLTRKANQVYIDNESVENNQVISQIERTNANSMFEENSVQNIEE